MFGKDHSSEIGIEGYEDGIDHNCISQDLRVVRRSNDVGDLFYLMTGFGQRCRYAARNILIDEDTH